MVHQKGLYWKNTPAIGFGVFTALSCVYVSLVQKYHSSFFANMWLLSSLLLELCWCISVWFPWYYLKKYSSRSVSYSKLCTWALRWGSSINSSLCCSNLLSLVYTSITWMLVAHETIMDIVCKCQLVGMMTNYQCHSSRFLSKLYWVLKTIRWWQNMRFLVYA